MNKNENTQTDMLNWGEVSVGIKNNGWPEKFKKGEKSFAGKEASFFFNKVEQRGDDECWPWAGTLNSKGYGVIQIHGRQYVASRIIYIISTGPFQEELFACHSCDNPPCCNPAHIWIGTCLENNKDMVSKGRQAFGDKNGSRTHPERLARGDRNGSRLHPERIRRGENHRWWKNPEFVGESHPNSKLTENKVKEIISLYSSGVRPIRSLAKEFAVSKATIWNVTSGKYWKHVRAGTTTDV